MCCFAGQNRIWIIGARQTGSCRYRMLNDAMMGGLAVSSWNGVHDKGVARLVAMYDFILEACCAARRLKEDKSRWMQMFGVVQFQK